MVIAAVLTGVVVAPRLWWWVIVLAGVAALVLFEGRRRRGGGTFVLRLGAADVVAWLLGVGAWLVSETVSSAGAPNLTRISWLSGSGVPAAVLEVAVLAGLGGVLARRFARARPDVIESPIPVQRPSPEHVAWRAEHNYGWRPDDRVDDSRRGRGWRS